MHLDMDFYKSTIEKLPIGYAYHKIICNDDGIPCDYEFIEVNLAFESSTGFKNADIVGKTITELAPWIVKNRLDLIKKIWRYCT